MHGHKIFLPWSYMQMQSVAESTTMQILSVMFFEQNLAKLWNFTPESFRLYSKLFVMLFYWWDFLLF